MEIKCKVCGTINDENTNFCKGCFQKLDIEDSELEQVKQEIESNNEEEKIHSKIIEEVDLSKVWLQDNDEVKEESVSLEAKMDEAEQYMIDSLKEEIIEETNYDPELEPENNKETNEQDINIESIDNVEESNFEPENIEQEESITEPIIENEVPTLEPIISTETVELQPMVESVEESITEEENIEQTLIENEIFTFDSMEQTIDVENNIEQVDLKPIEDNMEEIYEEKEAILESVEEESEGKNNIELQPMEENKEEAITKNEVSNFEPISNIEQLEIKPIEENNMAEEIKEESVEITPFMFESFEQPVEELEENSIENVEIQPIENIETEEITQDEKIEEVIEELDEENVESKTETISLEEIENEKINSKIQEESASIEKVRRIKRTKSKECKEIDSKVKLIMKFILVFIVCYILGYFLQGLVNIAIAYIFKINPLENNLISYIVTISINVLAILLSAFISFRKTIPTEKSAEKIIFTNYLLVIIPWIILTIAYNIFYMKLNYLAHTLLPIALILIYGQILYNFMRFIIKRRASYELEKSKNLIMIIITVIILLIGSYSLNKKIEINFSKDEEIIEDKVVLTDEQYVYAFIDTAQKNILYNRENISDYVIPNVINDITFVEYSGQYPEMIELNISNSGIVTSGKITYNGINYNYDGNTITKEEN